MDLLKAIRIFAQVVESNGFSRAGERLGVSATAVSRQVAELEAHLQTRLLHRTTRRLRLTESGQAFYGRAVQLLLDLEEAEQEASMSAIAPRGTIRLSTSITFGRRHVASAIAGFLTRHAEVQFDVQLSDRIVDLVEEGFDLAIRIGGTGSENLVARRLGETRLVLCAAPAYLEQHGTPARPQDLVGHNCFSYEYALPSNRWRFHGPDGREEMVRISGTVHSNNGDLHAMLAAQGVGIAYEPDFIVGDELRAGRLTELLPGHAAPPSPIYAVYPSRKHLSAKVRLFVEYLVEHFATLAEASPP